MLSLKVLKTALLGLVALAAFAGTASATVLTSPAGTAYTGTRISHGTALKMATAGECKTSTLHEEIESHGAAATAVSKVTSLSFSECGYPVTVTKAGTMEVHSLGNGNGTVTWSGAEIVLKTPVGDCLYTPNNTDMGTLTGSKNTGGTAVFDLSARVPRTGGNFLCGVQAEWNGTYVVQAPDYLGVD